MKLEELQDEAVRQSLESKDETVTLSDEEQQAALELLRDPKLLEPILTDYERCGVVGEEPTSWSATWSPSRANSMSRWRSSFSVHLSAKYAGYDDRQLATAASKLPGAAAGLPSPPKGYKDMNGILANSGYYNSELMQHCGPPK